MGTSDIQINRDEAADVLYVIDSRFDQSRTRNIQLAEYFTGRFDLTNQKCVGLTVEAFSVVFSESKDDTEYILQEKFEGILEYITATFTGKQLA